MKTTSFKLALQAAILGLALSSAGRAADVDMGASKQGLQAKLEYCKTCHGLQAQGYRGYYPMPRLAGQQPKYIDNQLRAFADRRRLNPVMANVAHALSPSTVAALAGHFAGLNPPPLGGAPKEDVALGRTIFELGIPEANIPACSACHAPDARGHGEIPRLAGQVFSYTVKELTEWSRLRGQGPGKDTSSIMVPTAHNLTQTQITALAAYVSALR